MRIKYLTEFRNKEIVSRLADYIRSISKKHVRFMEVCGGHTMAIQKFGIPSLLPDNIELLSGPGCPVCVTSNLFIDKAVAYSRLDNVIITSFGDLIRIPGSTSSLNREKANGRDIRMVYSTLDALNIARKNPDKKIIFLGIGFETTAPTSAAAILKADAENLENFYLYCSHKIMPPAMEALIDEGVELNGYIAPGHVSTITGSDIYKAIPDKFGLGCVISGFEPVDIMQSIYMLVRQYETNSPKVEIQYRRVVIPEGNVKAQGIMNEVFELRDDWWRGLGVLRNSGFTLKEKYDRFDAEEMLSVEVEETIEPGGCICGEILKGIKKPSDCKLFNKVCSPANPVGACMVSNEGACHAYYRYNK